MKTYKPLDLPTIPVHLLTQDFSVNTIQIDNHQRNLEFKMTRNGCIVNPARNRRWAITGALLEWIRSNISASFSNAGYAITQGAQDHLPHRDLIGDHKIYYVVKTGGVNVVTRFYDTPDGVPPGWRPDTFDNLLEIDSYCVPESTWVMINTRMLHGVTGIQDQRHMVSLTFHGEMP